jgi:hypothetical protein
MEKTEVKIEKGVNRCKVIQTIKMLRDSGLLVSLHQEYILGSFLLTFISELIEFKDEIQK